MTESYELVRAGKNTDFEVFWQHFDNYIVKASHYDNLDELVIGWYLSDEEHDSFYQRLFLEGDPLELILFYRKRRGMGGPADEGQAGWLRHLFHYRREDSRQYLEEHTLLMDRSDGECIGFCLYEWDGAGNSPCRILALSIAPGSEDHEKKSEIWKLLERRLDHDGVKILKTSGYQEKNFWLRNGFSPDGVNNMRKSI